ncbi:hypothetical protein CPJ18_02115 [Agrobacterium rosae]|uniref:Uncharacterized protein n=1 Tax=Agrobacterium rosae TaxID=1972867 RepID=A0AAE5VRD0_9HYPH|nr:hypothetical protein CPJ18_02115 [Agrobacterium rosae]
MVADWIILYSRCNRLRSEKSNRLLYRQLILGNQSARAYVQMIALQMVTLEQAAVLCSRMRLPKRHGKRLSQDVCVIHDDPLQGRVMGRNILL